MGPVSEGDLGGVYTVPYSEVGSEIIASLIMVMGLSIIALRRQNPFQYSGLSWTRKFMTVTRGSAGERLPCSDPFGDTQRHLKNICH